MSRNIYSSLDDAFQPLNPQQQKQYIDQQKSRVQQEEQTKRMWAKCEDRDFSDIYNRMSQGQSLPPYCTKENDQFKEFQRKSNEDRESYLRNMNSTPRPQISNDYQNMELGMYHLRHSEEDRQALVKVPNSQKAFLQKRLLELEAELKKYQFLLRTFDDERTPKLTNSPYSEDTIESFSNIEPSRKSGSGSSGDDIIDLIVLLAIGLLIIFVLDSVFKMGLHRTKK